MTVTDYIGVGGPLGIVFAALGFLLNAYLARRKAAREDVQIERESETGIVETTRQALAMAREEMTAQGLARLEDKREYQERVAALRAEKDSEIEQLRVRVAALLAELEASRGDNSR